MSAAPDRCSTWEEIRQATGMHPQRMLPLCFENSLLRELRADEVKSLDLGADELDFLLHLGELESQPLN